MLTNEQGGPCPQPQAAEVHKALRAPAGTQRSLTLLTVDKLSTVNLSTNTFLQLTYLWGEVTSCLPSEKVSLEEVRVHLFGEILSVTGALVGELVLWALS